MPIINPHFSLFPPLIIKKFANLQCFKIAKCNLPMASVFLLNMSDPKFHNFAKQFFNLLTNICLFIKNDTILVENILIQKHLPNIRIDIITCFILARIQTINAMFNARFCEFAFHINLIWQIQLKINFIDGIYLNKTIQKWTGLDCLSIGLEFGKAHVRIEQFSLHLFHHWSEFNTNNIAQLEKSLKLELT